MTTSKKKRAITTMKGHGGPRGNGINPSTRTTPKKATKKNRKKAKIVGEYRKCITAAGLSCS